MKLKAVEIVARIQGDVEQGGLSAAAEDAWGIVGSKGSY